MTNRDLRRIARENLRGNWGNAILAALIAGLLGGLMTGTGSFQVNIDAEAAQRLPAGVQQFLNYLAGFASVMGIVHFVVGGVIRQGYCRYLLKQYDGAQPELRDLFSEFSDFLCGFRRYLLKQYDGTQPELRDLFSKFLRGFCLKLLMKLYVYFWMLLFFIPALVCAFLERMTGHILFVFPLLILFSASVIAASIAQYRYAMAPFVLLENPDMTAKEAIRTSGKMMRGNKWTLFCLHFSFIGWSLLSMLTLGIGILWLNPYCNAAEAAFYRDFRRTH